MSCLFNLYNAAICTMLDKQQVWFRHIGLVCVEIGLFTAEVEFILRLSAYGL